MSEQLIQDLDKLIKQAALDGALTKDAVEMFNGIIKENDGLRDSIKESEANLETSVKARDILRQERDSARTARDAFMQRIDELDNREKAITVLEMEAAHGKQRVADHKEMMTLIFKPGEIRRNAWGSVPGFDEHGYPSSHQANSNEDSTTHDE